MAGLQANQHFLLPAMAPSMYDLGMLFGVIILDTETGYQEGPVQLPAFGLGIHGLVYGGILGAVLYLGIQVPGLLRYGFRWTPAINLRNPGVQQVLRLLGPRLVTVGLIQVVFILQDNFASWLVEGSVSALVYGWLFMQVPETLIGTAIATVLLPTLSEQVTRGQDQAFHDTLNRALRILLAFTLPVMVLVGVGVRPVIDILGFDQAGADLVAWVTRAYLLGLLGHSLLEVAVRAFYAQQDARTPLKIYWAGVLVFFGLAFALAWLIGPAGIALANAVVFTGIAFILLRLLNRRYPSIIQVRGTLGRVLLACLAAGLVTAGLLWIGESLPVPGALVGLLAMGGGVLAAVPFIWPEIKLLLKM